MWDRRIGVTVDSDGAGSLPATDTWTVYDGANPYADFDDSGSLTTRYLYGPAVDMLLARVDASGDEDWYLTDNLGSVRQIVDSDGTVLHTTDYDSFGNPTDSADNEGDRFKYTAREWDELVDLYFYRARYYDPSTGRFISEDPIGFGGRDANLSRYVGNGPTTATDPSGLEVRTAAFSFGNKGGDESSSVADPNSNVGLGVLDKGQVQDPGLVGEEAGAYQRQVAEGYYNTADYNSQYTPPPPEPVERVVKFEFMRVRGPFELLADFLRGLGQPSAAYDLEVIAEDLEIALNPA